jgi:hypothetical protein
MGKAQDRSAALSAVVAAGRTQKAALAAVMAGVSLNTITAQNITDITAAGAAYDTAIQALVTACRALEDA